jgi:cupin fold WbuC family metalloprotein
MTDLLLIDESLLSHVSGMARDSARRRRNYNFHADESEPCNRLLNAIEPGSYIRPHRHLEPGKDETLVVLRGRLGAVYFDDSGQVTRTLLMAPASALVGVHTPRGAYHSFIALEPGTVFFEAKAGPYTPLAENEIAPWAPAENDPAAADYLAALERLFA